MSFRKTLRGMRMPLIAFMVALLVSPAAAHVPEHCTTEDILRRTDDKIRAHNILNAATARQDLIGTLEAAAQLVEVDGRLMSALTTWVACVKGG